MQLPHGAAFVVPVVFALLCCHTARKRGYSGTLWFVLGFFFNLFALIVIALLPDRNGSAALPTRHSLREHNR